jgi:hypothetical protein
MAALSADELSGIALNAGGFIGMPSIQTVAAIEELVQRAKEMEHWPDLAPGRKHGLFARVDARMRIHADASVPHGCIQVRDATGKVVVIMTASRMPPDDALPHPTEAL